MTLLHYILLIAVSALLSSIAFHYLRFGRISIALFYFCSIYLVFIISLPFAVDFYSYVFNNILNLPDARISILASLTFGMSIVTIYLLAKVSIQERQLRILNRDIALLKYNLKKSLNSDNSKLK